MRSDRLLSILMLLQVQERMTARDLAHRLEVSERSIYRDVDALSAAGVPIYSERGRKGGCALLPGFRSDLSGLTSDEAQALFVFTGRDTLGDLGLESHLQSALRKLLSVLPAPQRPDATRALERVIVDPRGWMRPREEVPNLRAVREAVWRDRQLRMSYRHSGNPQPDVLIVHPYGLVAKAGRWYLIAAEQNEPRLYRVARIQAVEILAEPSVRPPDLEVEALWDELRRRVEDRGPGVEVTALVPPDRVELILRMVAASVLEPARTDPEPDESGWSVLHFRFPSEGAARGILLGFGTDVEVLAPESLRHEFAEVAQAIVDLYATPVARRSLTDV